MSIGFYQTTVLPSPLRFGEEVKADGQNLAGQAKPESEPTFFPQAQFPSELAQPNGFGKTLAYGFNFLFNPKKLMTPVEKSLVDLVERLSQQIDQDKIRLKDNQVNQRDDYTCQAELFIDGKPYIFTRLGHVLKKSRFYLSSQAEKTQLQLDEYALHFEDWTSNLKLNSYNRYVRRMARKTMLKLCKAVDTQEGAIKKQLEMEAEVARLKEQYKLEQQAAAGKLIRF